MDALIILTAKLPNRKRPGFAVGEESDGWLVCRFSPAVDSQVPSLTPLISEDVLMLTRLATLTLAFFVFASSAQAAGEIFPDPGLEAAVRSALDLPRKSDIEALTDNLERVAKALERLELSEPPRPPRRETMKSDPAN